MKRLSILLLSALALIVNACEKHPANRLPGEHDTEFGKHLGGPGHGDEHAGKAAATEHPPVTKHGDPATEAKPGEAPKFFPEKK
jgi:hypothetical protein